MAVRMAVALVAEKVEQLASEMAANLVVEKADVMVGYSVGAWAEMMAAGTVDDLADMKVALLVHLWVVLRVDAKAEQKVGLKAMSWVDRKVEYLGNQLAERMESRMDEWKAWKRVLSTAAVSVTMMGHQKVRSMGLRKVACSVHTKVRP